MIPGIPTFWKALKPKLRKVDLGETWRALAQQGSRYRRATAVNLTLQNGQLVRRSHSTRQYDFSLDEPYPNQNRSISDADRPDLIHHSSIDTNSNSSKMKRREDRLCSIELDTNGRSGTNLTNVVAILEVQYT
jgi:hypothetical protein